MNMNNNLEKLCRFLIENKIANEDLANIIKNKSEKSETEITDIDEKDDVIKKYIDTDEFKALLENLKFIEENVDLFNGIYVDIPKIEVR